MDVSENYLLTLLKLIELNKKTEHGLSLLGFCFP